MELSFTLRNVLLGSTLLGVVGGVLGCFALLRRQSLLGDALAHAALPGVCLGYMLTRSKSPLPLFIGALVAGLVGAMLILAVVRLSRVKEDAAIGLVLSVFFGGGIVLLTHIQKLPYGNQSGLDKFLFGQAATLMPRDLRLMAVLGGITLLLTFAFYKELKLLCFDREFAASLGFPMRRLEVLLTTLLVTVVVVGLQTVGVVLVVATLVTPAAAARQWTERLSLMLLLAALVGGGAGAVGALVSASAPRLPTGPVIVLCSSLLLVASLLLAPRRGMAWALLAERRLAWRIREENLLKDLYAWGERAAALAATGGRAGDEAGRAHPAEERAPSATEARSTAAAEERSPTVTEGRSAGKTGEPSAGAAGVGPSGATGRPPVGGEVAAATIPWPTLMGGRGQSRGELLRVSRRLARRGEVVIEPAGLRLAPSGVTAAAGVVRRHRLWEVYLTRRLELASDHVHRDAEEMEHALSEEALRRLDELLGFPRLDPHGRPIPRPAGAGARSGEAAA